MEGPSLHLLADELQFLVNQKIVEAFGNASFDKEVLPNQLIKNIYAFGKRLIIQCQDHALTVHFLMYGSYRIDKAREGMAPRLALITKGNALYLYNCSIKCIATKALKKSLDLSTDVLSDKWDARKALRTIRSHPEERIDDILLDQDIFGGVGNIIKNEVLWRTGINPHALIAQLSLKHIKRVIEDARIFSQCFLAWRKEFVLKKNLKIYRKKLCPRCHHAIIRQKTGLRKRWSYYCPTCQPL